MTPAVRKAFSEAIHLQDQGKRDASIALLEKLTNLELGEAIIVATLAQAYWDAGRLEEASTLFRKAIELDPYSEVFSLNLFHLLWHQKKHQEALEETKRFMRLSDSEDYRRIISEINSETDNK